MKTLALTRLPDSAVRQSLVVLALLLALLPFLRAGFFFDDIYNSVLPGEIMARGWTLGEFIERYIKGWAIQNSRLFPISLWFTYSSWFWFGSLWASHLVQYSLALVDVVLFFYLVRRLAPAARVPWLAVLFLTAVIQFNPRWDGLSSFVPLNPALVLIVLGAWIIGLAAMEAEEPRRRTALIAAATLVTAVALLTYEVAALAPAGIVLIAWTLRARAPRAAVAMVVGQCVVSALYLVAYFYIKRLGASGYDGVLLGSLGAIVPTFARQLLSAFPLAFVGNRVLGAAWPYLPLVLALWPLFALVWWRLMPARGTEDRPPESVAGSPLAWMLPLLLLLFPTALVSVSQKYQAVTRYGDPYIVVYVQYFGAAWLMALALHRVLRPSLPRRRMQVLAAVLGLVCALTVATNFRRIDLKNDQFLRPRVPMEQAVERGLLSNVPPDGLLVVDSPYMWETEGTLDGLGLCAAFFSHYAERPLHCLGLQNYLKLDSLPPNLGKGGVFLLRRTTGPDGKPAVQLHGNGSRTTTSLDGKSVATVWREADSDVVLADIGEGFYSWEPTGGREWAWSAGPADLVLLNLSARQQPRVVTLTLQSPTKQQLVGSIAGAEVFRLDAQTSDPLRTEMTIPLAPGRTVVHIKPSAAPVSLNPRDPRVFAFRLLSVTVK